LQSSLIIHIDDGIPCFVVIAGVLHEYRWLGADNDGGWIVDLPVFRTFLMDDE
jgi:hypothetical protein